MDNNDNHSYIIPISDLSVVTNVEDLICLICLNICFKPLMLECCEHLICTHCLNNLLKYSNSCPCCKTKNVTTTKPPKIILRLFDNLTFNCIRTKCKQRINYSLYFDHIYNTCDLISNEEKTFKYCKECKCIVDVSHECTLNQLSKLSLSDVNLSQETLMQIHIHPLILTNQRIHNGYSTGWLCELCDDNIRNPLTKSYHCEECLFDICEKCFKYIITRKPNKRIHNHEIHLEQRESEWICNRCDKLYYMRRSWFCNHCDFDVCVYCYWTNNNY